MILSYSMYCPVLLTQHTEKRKIHPKRKFIIDHECRVAVNHIYLSWGGDMQ